ncbi:hypothetical protein CQA18_24610, partial [Enterobacter hormaechei]|uniref:hypothetical protein n=1 Tax=Enterobacter hormaechei TaxID=158836 RepID=UPI000BCEEA16
DERFAPTTPGSTGRTADTTSPNMARQVVVAFAGEPPDAMTLRPKAGKASFINEASMLLPGMQSRIAG